MAWQTRPKKIRSEPAQDAAAHGPPRAVAPFVSGLPVRRSAARGLYRIFNAAAFRFYRGAVPPAEGDAPFATAATLPATPASAFADGTWYLSMSYFDGVLDSGFLAVGSQGETFLKMVVSGGALLPAAPSAPVSASLEVRAAGVIRVLATYLPQLDAAGAKATMWGVAYTTTGATPPNNTPTASPTLRGSSTAVLSYDLPAQADGTVVKVQLQTWYRTGGGVFVFSLPGPVLSAVARANGPAAPLDARDWAGAI